MQRVTAELPPHAGILPPRPPRVAVRLGHDLIEDADPIRVIRDAGLRRPVPVHGVTSGNCCSFASRSASVTSITRRAASVLRVAM